MASFKGFYINLERDKDRENILRNDLGKKGKLTQYTRFKAIEGNAEEATKRSLSAGEHGLWKSWIKLLEIIEQDNDRNYDYIHIIEDDAVLSNQLYDLLDQLGKEETSTDMLMTDMYTNISVYNVFEKHVPKSISEDKEWKVFTTNQYTGCTASCIIHKNKIKDIRALLKEEYKSRSLIPIDNFFRRMSIKGNLRIRTTIPFLSTVQISSIINSTIQNRNNKASTITNTQVYNAYLRKRLSVFRSDAKIIEMAKIAADIIGQEGEQKDNFESKIIESINSFLEDEGILRYKVDKRLKGDENHQIKT